MEVAPRKEEETTWDIITSHIVKPKHSAVMRSTETPIHLQCKCIIGHEMFNT
jgi:hypothetical protein